jgi:predicted nucleic acid-binding protein
VWSLALRRDAPSAAPQVRAVARAIESGEMLVATGLVLQEILQGFSGPRQRRLILDRFSAIPLLMPDRDDHVAAAELRNQCRRHGVQIATIDALLARLCIRHDLAMLSTDHDFERIAQHSGLRLWQPDVPRR